MSLSYPFHVCLTRSRLPTLVLVRPRPHALVLILGLLSRVTPSHAHYSLTQPYDQGKFFYGVGGVNLTGNVSYGATILSTRDSLMADLALALDKG